ncbi:MAG TPA: homoserine O-acetyltransferase [Beijerinckiaceae bacterium]|jgi:homoserine O-acetyltransferase|nr:homoserine O-acetyltransferase [Beijerinckiaceae bacterium]
MIVEKRVFELPRLETVGGATIFDVRVGYETYGTLNADRSNAILVCHYFSGTSHAAGRYRESDVLPGYWDYLIGPGKAIDTDRYFVVSSDTLVNLSAYDPTVTTTGPASTDPATGKPYGLSFPFVTIADFVRVQKALLDHLGIAHLHAVMGPSMGGLQTYEWAASFPDMMDRIIPVIAAADSGPWLTAWLDVWASPIRVDPNWNGGDYYGRQPPLQGLTQALKIVTLHANHWHWAEKYIGPRWAQEARDPLAALDNRYRIEEVLEEAAAGRVAVSDANHFLYLVKANQSFIPGRGAGATSAAEGLKRIKARALVLYAPSDQVFAAEWVERTAKTIAANGTSVETAQIEGDFGHLNGVLGLGKLGPQIAEFLAR